MIQIIRQEIEIEEQSEEYFNKKISVNNNTNKIIYRPSNFPPSSNSISLYPNLFEV